MIASEARSSPFAVFRLLKRDKLNLDIFWLQDKSLDDADALPDADVITDDLLAAYQQFAAITADLKV